jgi:dihydroorotate dehydrogenase (NAD+) catalytic subunit
MAKHDLSFVPPVMNAAGSLGFTPDLHRSLDWSQFGAFITNPISLLPRTPAHGTRFTNYPGGFLLHTGYPNPGLKHMLRQHARHWQRAPVPVIVHLLGGSPEELLARTRRLENVEGVSGLEVGFPYEADSAMVSACLQAASGELPVIAQLPPERSLELAPLAIQAGTAMVSLSAPRGLLPTPGGELVQGRLFGPAVFPTALKVVSCLAQLGIPTIGRGGIYAQEHVQAMQKAGAVAVQLDSLLWREAGYRILT